MSPDHHNLWKAMLLGVGLLAVLGIATNQLLSHLIETRRPLHTSNTGPQIAHLDPDKQHLTRYTTGIRIKNDLVSLSRNPQGHYMTTGDINGQAVLFLLDTGATNVSIPGEVAYQLGLIKGRSLKVDTAGGIVRAYETKLKKVGIGELSVDNISGVIIPEMPGETVLLGMSFLKYFEITQNQDGLILRKF